MKRFHGSIVLSLVIAMALWISPSSAVFASNDMVQSGTVAASAIIVPAQIAHLSYITSGIIKEILVKEGDLVQAGQIMVVLNNPDLEYGVTAAEAELHSLQAEEKVQSYKTYRVYKYGNYHIYPAPREVRLIANAHVQQAQAALDIAKASLAQGTLTAPFTGTIAAMDVIPGEFVQSGQVIITLAGLDTLQIETTDLSERDIKKVQVGGTANIFREALDQNLSGKIVRISPIADVVGGDVVYKVTIKFDRQPENLRWGMTAEVTINE